jgi:endonuclease III
MKITIEALKRSRLYSEELGIKLGKNDKECFKWFLASILFGGRISETIAKKTYRTFERYELLAPQKILEAGRDFLVNPIMREGGYVRYDGRKSMQILRDAEMLRDEYGGSLNTLHRISINSRDLENRLLAFYGIGPVTVNIFLRELRPYWRKSDPEPLPIVKKLAMKLDLDLDRYRRNTITYTRIEAGLIRLRKQNLT